MSDVYQVIYSPEALNDIRKIIHILPMNYRFLRPQRIK